MTDLPAVLMRTRGGVAVEVSDEAGGFYCEHCLFAARRAVDDGVVVGFLHVPPDATLAGTPQALRHRHTREVVAAAVAGLLASSSSPLLRILLTGFRPWDRVQRNPSGDFVTHAGNIDAVVAAVGGRITGVIDGRRRASVAGRTLEVARAVLPVDDRALDGGPLSVQAAIARHRPDVVLSMGVHRQASRFRVERNATDRRLRHGGGGFAHDEGLTVATTRLPPDERLARAILSGWRSSTSTSTDPSATGPAPAS